MRDTAWAELNVAESVPFGANEATIRRARLCVCVCKSVRVVVSESNNRNSPAFPLLYGEDGTLVFGSGRNIVRIFLISIFPSILECHFSHLTVLSAHAVHFCAQNATNLIINVCS